MIVMLVKVALQSMTMWEIISACQSGLAHSIMDLPVRGVHGMEGSAQMDPSAMSTIGSIMVNEACPSTWKLLAHGQNPWTLLEMVTPLGIDYISWKAG